MQLIHTLYTDHIRLYTYHIQLYTYYMQLYTFFYISYTHFIHNLYANHLKNATEWFVATTETGNSGPIW